MEFLVMFVCLLAARWKATKAVPIPFDCSAGISDWRSGWSTDKMQYCCQTAGVGCQATTTTLCQQDCKAGLSNWERGWSTYKKEWCCKHEGVGCSRSTSKTFDCHGEPSEISEWPTAKAKWCCEKKGVGCTTTTTTTCKVDCQVGLNNWEKGWGQWKKDYCCKHEKLGCPEAQVTTTTPCTFDCQAGLNNWEMGWAQSKKEWCCKHEQLGCPITSTSTTTVTSTTPKHDCRYLGGFWSDEKQEWCCKHEKRGCKTSTQTSTRTSSTATSTTVTSTTASTTSTSTLPYNCTVGFTNCYHCLERRWTFNKRTWCCQHFERGCPTTRTSTTTTTTTPDCSVKSHESVESWGLAKRSWCCANAEVGCETSTTTSTATTTTVSTTTTTATNTTTTTFNCISSGDENPHSSWSSGQRQWCCKHKGYGCTTTATTTTTTPPLYDCMAHLDTWFHWTQEKKEWCCQRDSRNCPSTVTTTTTERTTTNVPDSKVLSCNLNCFGQGAEPVRLPGSLGAGSGASLNDVSLQECRNACGSTHGCEAVLFTNHTKGVPWKSMCFGKRNIHTSRCQPGGAYRTEIINSRPWGKCAVFGDPHVITWDRVYGPPITMTDPGEYYLVESEHLKIHGRFGYTHRFPTASSTVGIAVGGPYINGHTLVVTYVGPEQGPKGFRVFWDGQPILAKYPSHFNSKDGTVRASHDAMDPEKYHREGRHTIGGTSGLLPSYYFQFQSDLNLYVLLGPDNCNAVIETRKVDGAQDGYCGNFNCIKEDDSLEALRSRGMLGTIPEGMSLFRYAPKPPAWVMKKVKRPSLKDCDPAIKAKATKACRGLPHGEESACIFDACAANRTEVVHEDIKVMALPFNCQQGQLDTWALEKKEWCCKRENIGCSPGHEQPETSLQGCHAMCTFEGQTASCFARTQWAAQHTYLGKEQPCLQAHKLVLSQCSSCSACTAEAVGCTGRKGDGDGMVFFKRLYEENRLYEAGDAGGGDQEDRLPGGGVLRLPAAGIGALGVILLASSLLLRGGGCCRRRSWSFEAQESSEHTSLLDREPGLGQ